VRGEIFRTCPDRPWGPLSLLYNGYRVFPGGKERPGRDADPSHLSSAVVMKEQSYTSTPPMGRTACTEPQCLYKGVRYLYLYLTYIYVERVVKTQSFSAERANIRVTFYFNSCTVRLLLLCIVTNKCTIISQIITLLHVSTLSCHPQGACNQYVAKSTYRACTTEASTYRPYIRSPHGLTS